MVMTGARKSALLGLKPPSPAPLRRMTRPFPGFDRPALTVGEDTFLARKAEFDALIAATSHASPHASSEGQENSNGSRHLGP